MPSCSSCSSCRRAQLEVPPVHPFQKEFLRLAVTSTNLNRHRVLGATERQWKFRFYVQPVEYFPPQLTRVGPRSICHTPLPSYLFFEFHLETFSESHCNRGGAGKKPLLSSAYLPLRRSAMPCKLRFLYLPVRQPFVIGCLLSLSLCHRKAATGYIHSLIEGGHSQDATQLF